MPKFAANLSFMFTELPFLDRFAAAAAAGFDAVEYLFPYDYPGEVLAARLQDAGLTQALFNSPAGDWTAGERGLACLPDRVEQFRAGVRKAIEYAGVLDCRRVHVMAGLADPGADPGADPATLSATYRDNLAYAAEAFAEHGITALIEPINQRDIPGFYLRDSGHALAVIAEVGRANLKLQYDVYHAQITEGDLAKTIEAAFDRIGHIQIANPPDRHEPDDGEINYPYIFALLDRLGFDGWIGCEYRPRAGTTEGLAWAAEYGIGS